MTSSDRVTKENREPAGAAANTARSFGAVLKIFAVVALPVSAFSVVQQYIAETPHFIVVQFLAILFAVGGGYLPRASERTRQLLFCIGMSVGVLTTLLHFGPLAGVGLIILGAALIVTVFFRIPGLTVYLVSFATAFALIAAGVLPLSEVAFVPGTAADWIRLGVTCTGASGGVAFLVNRLIERLESSVEQIDRALRSELEAHAQREESLRRMAAAQRLEALGRLAGGVAHDFNNALAVIQSGASLLELDDIEPDEHDEIVEDILSAARAAHETTEQLRAFARGDRDRGDPSYPSEVLQSVQSSLRSLLPADIELVLVKPDIDVAVALTPGGLHQILINLCLNARDAIDGAGTIELGWRHQDDIVTIWVEDDGSGMNDATASQIFEPFFTTKGESGTGLGLAMVHGTIIGAGGAIHVDTAPGSGTRIELDLPISDAPVRPKPTRTPTPIPIERRACVLLVDDRVDLLRMMTRELEAGGYDVVAADSVGSALQIIDTGRFDLLCTDGILPDGRATDVIKAWAASRNRARPVIVCSGYLEEDILADPDDSPHHFLAKPYAAGALAELVGRLIEATRSTNVA